MAKFLKVLKWIICLSLFAAFGVLTFMVMNGKLYLLDNTVYKHLFAFLEPLNLTTPFKVITNLGGPELLIFLCFILLILVQDRKVGVGISLNLVLCTLLNILVKNIVLRPRPSVASLIVENGYSFPSGHAMASMAFYGFIIYLLWQSKYRKSWKILGTTILTLVILIVGLSRIYLGVHYFSDIICGYILALGYLIIFITVFNKVNIPKKKKRRKKVAINNKID